MKRGYRKPRKVRPVEKNIPAGYDSKWEYSFNYNIAAIICRYIFLGSLIQFFAYLEQVFADFL